MSKMSSLPFWWLDLTHGEPFSPVQMTALLADVERRGISKNDRPKVQEIWLEHRRLRRLNLPVPPPGFLDEPDRPEAA